MGFCCSDIMKLPCGAGIALLGGGEGLERAVREVYVAEIMQSIFTAPDWLLEDKLVVTSGRSVDGDAEGVFPEFIRLCARKGVAGVVTGTGRFLTRIPEEAARRADLLGIPLMVLPAQEELMGFTRQLCAEISDRAAREGVGDSLADKLLLGEGLGDRETQEELERLGFSTLGIYLVSIFEPFAGGGAPPEAGVYANLSRQLQELLQHNLGPTLIAAHGGSLAAITQIERPKDTERKPLAGIVQTLCARYGVQIRAGAGKRCRGVARIPESFDTAQQALKVQRWDGSRPVMLFEDVGLYGLLFSTDEELLLNYYNDLFAPLIEYDKNNNSALMYTLEKYLEHDARTAGTAKELYIHENTLKYRLGKIRSLMNLDLGRLEAQSRILIGLKIGHMLHGHGPEEGAGRGEAD